ncbi:MAG TPA: PqiC family protein [Caldimonas sp.]|nr:PqiC family protein [Caldimonas sp.]
MNPFDCRLAVLAAAVLVVAACATPPPLRLHTLVPADSAMRAPAGPSVLLAPISVPPALNDPRWLVRMPDGSLSRLENDRWASPLPDELRAALLQVLASRHGVVEARSPGAPAPQWQARIDVTRFDTAADGDVVEEGVWALSPVAAASAPATPAAGSLRCTFAWHENAGTGSPALAEAHRRAVAHLADAIGAAVVAAVRGQAPDCPR